MVIAMLLKHLAISFKLSLDVHMNAHLTARFTSYRDFGCTPRLSLIPGTGIVYARLAAHTCIDLVEKL